MARNWSSASNGGLSDLVDAFHQGKKTANDYEDRKRDWGQTKLKNAQEQAQKDPYNEIQMDEEGRPIGLKENRALQRRDQRPGQTRYPEMFRRAPAPAASAPPKAPAAPAEIDSLKETEAMNSAPGAQDQREKDRAAMIERMKASGQIPQDYVEPNRAPQGSNAGKPEMDPGDPKPLLRDPKAAQTEASQLTDMAVATGKTIKQPVGDAVPTGLKNSEGGDVKVQPVNQGVAFGDAQVTAPAPEAPTAPAPDASGPAPIGDEGEDFDPSPYMRKRITDLATTSPKVSNASNETIDLEGLPAPLKARLGLPPDATGPIKVSTLEKWLAGEFGAANVKTRTEAQKNQQATANAFDANVLGPLVSDLRGGRPLGEILEEFEAIAGRPPSKREDAVLNRVFQATEAEKRAGISGESKGIEPGYRRKSDGSVEPIPGSKAATEAQQKKDKIGAGKAGQKRNADIVVEDVDRILDKIKKNPRSVGPWRGHAKAVPGTDAYDINNMLDTIRANASFDRLQAMRDASPTGGALGAVSDNENKLLQAAIGKLDVTMNKEDFLYNLRRVKDMYSDIVHGPGNEAPATEEAPAATSDHMKLSKQATEAMRAIDQSKKLNGAQKRAEKAKVSKKFEEMTGVPWGRKDGSEVP